MTDKEFRRIVTGQLARCFVPIGLAIVHSIFAFVAPQSYFYLSIAAEMGIVLISFLMMQVMYFFHPQSVFAQAEADPYIKDVSKDSYFERGVTFGKLDYGYYGAVRLYRHPADDCPGERVSSNPLRGHSYLRRIHDHLHEIDGTRRNYCATIGSVVGAVILYGIGRLLDVERLEKSWIVGAYPPR